MMESSIKVGFHTAQLNTYNLQSANDEKLFPAFMQKYPVSQFIKS